MLLLLGGTVGTKHHRCEAVLRECRVEPGAGGGGRLESQGDRPRLKWTRGIVGVLLAWGYTTDGLGNLDFDVIGAADSLTGHLMFVVVPVIVIVVLLSAWIEG